MYKYILLFLALGCFSIGLHGQVVIGIAGGSGSGKTTLANKVVESFGDHAALISLDSYYKDFSGLTPEERENLNFDHPNSLDFSLLRQQLHSLKQNQPIEMPVYDFVTHARISGSRVVEPKPIIIVEGILVLADAELRDMFDLKIYIDTDDDIRVLRRIERDVMERGRTFQSINKQYISTVKPMHNEFVEPSKSHADIVLYGVNDNANLVTKLLSSYAY